MSFLPKVILSRDGISGLVLLPQRYDLTNSHRSQEIPVSSHDPQGTGEDSILQHHRPKPMEG